MYQLRLFHKKREFYLSFALITLLCITAFILSCISNYGSDSLLTVPAFRRFVWLEGGMDTGLINYMLIYTIPIFAVLPFADSFFADRSSNILPVLIYRKGAVNYFFSKLLAVALSAFEIIFIPLGLNLTLNMISSPLYGSTMQKAGAGPSADQSYFNSEWFLGNIMFPELYIKHPYIYELLFLTLTTVFAVLCTVVIYEISFFIKRGRLAIIAIFFVVCDVLILISSFVPIDTNVFDYLIAARVAYSRNNMFFLGMFVLPLVAILALAPLCIRKLKTNGGD